MGWDEDEDGVKVLGRWHFTLKSMCVFLFVGCFGSFCFLNRMVCILFGTTWTKLVV